jgi:hypothetical protein
MAFISLLAVLVPVKFVVTGGSRYCAHTYLLKCMTSLWMECVSPKREFDKWHNLLRLLGECKDNGVN